MARQWPVAGVVLAGLWLFVRGVVLVPSRILGEFLIGLAFGLPVAYASRRFYADRVNVGRAIRAIPYAVLYLLVFLRELIVANVEVAYRVLAPGMPIDPDVVVFPLRVRSDIAITTIANSITLTPGTLTMDYDDEENVLLVHTIHGRDPAAVKSPIRQWEEYALVIFDEELKPGDPVPETPYDIEERAESRPGDAGGEGRGG